MFDWFTGRKWKQLYDEATRAVAAAGVKAEALIAENDRLREELESAQQRLVSQQDAHASDLRKITDHYAYAATRFPVFNAPPVSPVSPPPDVNKNTKLTNRGRQRLAAQDFYAAQEKLHSRSSEAPDETAA